MTQSKLSRGLLRNCNLFANQDDFIGQIGDITLPVPTEKLEEMRNSGMIKSREVGMGYEKLDFSFKAPGLDPIMLKLLGVKIGSETSFMVTGATVDEDGTVHSAVMTIRGRMNKADSGSWQPGAMAGNDYAVSVNYYKLEIDGEEIYEMDDFDFKVGGVSLYGDIRNALLL